MSCSGCRKAGPECGEVDSMRIYHIALRALRPLSSKSYPVASATSSARDAFYIPTLSSPRLLAMTRRSDMLCTRMLLPTQHPPSESQRSPGCIYDMKPSTNDNETCLIFLINIPHVNSIRQRNFPNFPGKSHPSSPHERSNPSSRSRCITVHHLATPHHHSVHPPNSASGLAILHRTHPRISIKRTYSRS